MKKLSILILLIGAVLLYGYYEKKQLEEVLTRAEGKTLLNVIPDITLPNYQTKNSEKLLELVKQKSITVVHFWATWCGPCEKEFPDLLRLINKLDDKKIQFVLIAVDDKTADIKKFLTKFNSISQNYLLLVDSVQAHRNHFGISKLPETYVFDQAGSVIRSLVGPQDWLSTPFLKYFNNLAN